MHQRVRRNWPVGDASSMPLSSPARGYRLSSKNKELCAWAVKLDCTPWLGRNLLALGGPG